MRKILVLGLLFALCIVVSPVAAGIIKFDTRGIPTYPRYDVSVDVIYSVDGEAGATGTFDALSSKQIVLDDDVSNIKYAFPNPATGIYSHSIYLVDHTLVTLNTGDTIYVPSETGTFTVSGSGTTTVTAYYVLDTSVVAPVAGFTASPSTGGAPLMVQFTDASVNSPTYWWWDFDNDGVTDSTEQNPSHTYDQAGTYTVSLTVWNAKGFDTEDSTIIVTGTNSPPDVTTAPSLSGFEGSPVNFIASATDPDGDDLSFTWDLDGDGVIDSNEASCSHTYSEDGQYGATLVVSDGTESVQRSVTVNIANVAPVITGVTASTGPGAVGTEVTANALFTDAGVLDTHTAVWSWGDESTSEGVVTESAGSVIGSHVYAQPGIYAVSVVVSDDDGGSDEKTATTATVVYDPNGGFATGGGWFNSPEGAYPADPSLSGKANFAMVCKYKKGMTEPENSAKFQFKAADIDFEAIDTEWLVVVGSKATYQGTGTLNGGESCKFLITVNDGPDKIRVRLWTDNGETEHVVYDNMPGSADTADPIAPLGGGSIVVHG